MSLPDENLRAQKRVPKLINQLMWRVRSKRFLLKLLLSKKARHELALEMHYCAKHYPFDYQLDKLWEPEIKRMEESFAKD